MINSNLIEHIFLAEDDEDDCALFEDVLNELLITSKLTIARNGHLLMDSLHKAQFLPDILFLDLNMPMKNGLECLQIMKQDDNLKKIPVIIFSTSAQSDVIDITYNQGANFYIQKPDTFSSLKRAIHKALSIDWKNYPPLPREEFFWGE